MVAAKTKGGGRPDGGFGFDFPPKHLETYVIRLPRGSRLTSFTFHVDVEDHNVTRCLPLPRGSFPDRSTDDALAPPSRSR